MNVAQRKTFCASLAGATDKLHADPGNILVYCVGGKHFTYFKTSAPEKWRFSLRVNPDRFIELTDMPGVKPARYMGRYHWITIVKVQQFPGTYLTELVQWSYQFAFGSLSRARQRAILATIDASSALTPKESA